MQSRAGFSLVELLVATAILGIVTIGLVQTFSDSQKTYVVVDQVSEAQQNLRVVADLMERDLRMAGYMVPSHGAVCAIDATNGPDSLFVSSADVILSAEDLRAQNYTSLVNGNLGGEVTGDAPGINYSGNGIGLNLVNMSVDLPGDPADNDFVVGGGVILVDRNDANGRSACGRIVDASNPDANGAGTIRIDILSEDLGPLGANPDVVAIPANVYTVTPPNPGAGTPGQLLRNGVLIANDVEDLQLGFFFDDDDDRVMDPGEYMGDLGEAVGDGNAVGYASDAADGRRLLQVEVNLITTTREEDPNDQAPQTIQQTTGNRDPLSLDAPDRRKRRVYTSTVRLRNA